MKQKMVYYYDMFKQDQVIQAKNRLDKRANVLRTVIGGARTRMVFGSDEEKKQYLIEKARKTKCQCHHPRFFGRDHCTFHNCFHNKEEHN